MKKIILGIILSIFICSGASFSVCAEEDVIMISTPEELDAVRENLAGNYKLANDIDMRGYYTFEPIGNALDGAFTGTFDGNGYTIKNLDLNYGSYKYVGLFGYLDGPVKNINLENVEVEASRYGGGIAGYADENGTIENCNVDGSICVVNTQSQFVTYEGGIAGYSGAIIKGCIVNGEIGSSVGSYVGDCRFW